MEIRGTITAIEEEREKPYVFVTVRLFQKWDHEIGSMPSWDKIHLGKCTLTQEEPVMVAINLERHATS